MKNKTIADLFRLVNFFKFFGEQEVVKLSKLKAVFTSSTRKKAGKVDNHIAYGGYVLISAIARKTSCYEILNILALCTYGVSEGDLISQQFSSWCFGHYCGLDRTVSGKIILTPSSKPDTPSIIITFFFEYSAESPQRYRPIFV